MDWRSPARRRGHLSEREQKKAAGPLPARLRSSSLGNQDFELVEPVPVVDPELGVVDLRPAWAPRDVELSDSLP